MYTYILADPLHYSLLFKSSCDVPCDKLLNSVCQKIIDAVPGETHEITITLMHVDELVYAVVSHNHTGYQLHDRRKVSAFIFVFVSVSTA